jgi:O-methyltransferase involved in polyketide biosynthesis
VADFDASKPSIARVYDYLAGGRDNFAADRALAGRLTEIAPSVPEAVRENRAMLSRAVRWSAERGVRQFIDLGGGLPTDPGTHQTARLVAPEAKVAYVDNDPVVILHLNALLHKDPAVAVIAEDLDDTDAVLGAVTGVIDLSQPACLLMGALLHFYEAAAAAALVSRYAAALAPGSYAVLTVIGAVPGKDEVARLYSEALHPVHPCSAADLESFCAGLEVLPPGAVDARAWCAGAQTVRVPEPRDVWVCGLMAKVAG